MAALQNSVKRSRKDYVAVFWGFSTKVIHVEIVSDLTTDVYIGVLKKFIGHRRRCRQIDSDKATNFIDT